MKKNKLITVFISFLVVLIISAGCSSSATTKETQEKKDAQTTSESKSKGIYKDGTYEGTSDAGIHPGLKMSVVIKNGNISEVNVIESNETEGIGQTALEKLPSQIVEKQSTDIEAVSGASKTSAAVKEAVDLALEQAK